MRKIVSAFAALAAILVSAPASAADVINENFESGTFGVFTAHDQVGVNTGQDYHDCCGHTGSPAALANHFASFGSGDKPSGTISAAMNLTLGETYTLYFDLASMGAGADAAWFAVDGSHWNVVQPANTDLDH